MDARRFRAGCCRLTALIGMLVATSGCHLPWQLRPGEEPADAPAKQNAASAATGTPKPDAPQPELPKAMADDRWVQASTLAVREPGPAGYFWEHQALEAWAAVGGDHRAQLTPALTNVNPVIASNAAILLSRTGDAAAVDRLAATVGNTELRLPLRCAAVEALAHLDDAAATAELEKLVELFGQFSGPAQAAYVPRLHAELLIELARRGANQDNTPFTHAFQSPSPEVRRAALQAWLNPARTDFPAAALELRGDATPSVRAAVLAALAVQQPEQAREILTRGLDGPDIDTRMAAIAGLAKLGGEESKASLLKLCKHPSEVARAEVVIGLARLGANDAVLAAAKDKSWLVRQAVATSLARPVGANEPVGDDTQALAQTLLHDQSLEVQRRALESAATWPLAQAGPVLLTAMSEGGHQMRKDAARQLGPRWPAAKNFPYDSAADVRAKAIGVLRQQWGGEFAPIGEVVAQVHAEPPAHHGLSPEQSEKLNTQLQALRSPQLTTTQRQQAVETLVEFGPALIAALEQAAGESSEPLPPLVYDEVLPQVSPLFAAISGLHSSGLPQRRTAATQLVLAAAGQNISLLALGQLAELAKTETDPIVWQSLLSATAEDPREEALNLAYIGIGNGSPEVRRRACNYLAAHGDRRHVPVLIPVLADLNTPVVQAAVQALGAVGSINDPQPLIQMLITQDKQLRLEVATSLARLKVPEGPPALERLALDADSEVCRRAVVAMGQLGDKVYLPTLLELLSASVDVQLAAFNSLAELTGEDFSRTPEGLPVARDEQVRRWQRWNRDQQADEK